VSLSIVFAVLFSALLHATWNSLAHAVSDRLVGFALIGVADGIGGALMVVFAGLPPAGAWPFIIASAALHVAYNLLLTTRITSSFVASTEAPASFCHCKRSAST
jgi:RsiW-degrading membrane proteinase PrsW (M82 family)